MRSYGRRKRSIIGIRRENCLNRTKLLFFSDRSKKAKDHSRVNNNLLEILPDKPPRKFEKFSIEDDKDLLINSLQKYKFFQ